MMFFGVMGHGPDFKARTDQLEREEKERIKKKRNRRLAPERVRSELNFNRSATEPEVRSSFLTRVWRRIRGIAS